MSTLPIDTNSAGMLQRILYDPFFIKKTAFRNAHAYQKSREIHQYLLSKIKYRSFSEKETETKISSSRKSLFFISLSLYVIFSIPSFLILLIITYISFFHTKICKVNPDGLRKRKPLMALYTIRGFCVFSSYPRRFSRNSRFFSSP